MQSFSASCTAQLEKATKFIVVDLAINVATHKIVQSFDATERTVHLPVAQRSLLRVVPFSVDAVK